jgi:hypothetical protein
VHDGFVTGPGLLTALLVASTAGFWTTTDSILHDKDGETRTVVTTGAFVDDIAVTDRMLFFTLDHDDGQVYGFTLATGRLRWVLRPRERVTDFEAGDGSRIELLDDKLLVYAPPALIAVDPATGVPAWSARVPALEGRWGTLRATSDGETWTVTIDGVVVALDAATGAVQRTHDGGVGVPYEPDEAEIAKGLEVRIEQGRVVAVRWVRRSELGAGALRLPFVELPVAEDGDLARLELSTPDARLVVDAARVVARDGTIVVEVPGAWEDARLVTDQDDLIALD